jgi:hypothetical protein
MVIRTPVSLIARGVWIARLRVDRRGSVARRRVVRRRIVCWVVRRIWRRVICGIVGGIVRRRIVCWIVRIIRGIIGIRGLGRRRGEVVRLREVLSVRGGAGRTIASSGVGGIFLLTCVSMSRILLDHP